MSNFIETEPLEYAGEPGEAEVWNVVKQAFRHSDCLGYWRYPIFSTMGKTRKEPDILIADKQFGLIVIEVKGISIYNIVDIQGHRWQMQNFYSQHIQPYQQAENQLFAVAGWCDNEPLIRRRVSGRVVIALPYISREEWSERGFDRLPSSPSILFRDDLRLASFYERLESVTPLVHGQPLDDEQWQSLQVVLSGMTVVKKSTPGALEKPDTRRAIVDTVREQLVKFDFQQERIGKQIPPGIQRIRGIAGSGKTILLAQRAVHMHLKYPDWKIALVFFTRSLYQQILSLVDRWMRHFTQGQFKHDPNGNLKVYHAWGGHKQPGFYREICLAHRIKPLIVNDIKHQRLSPTDGLIYACQQLLEEARPMRPLFDAVLIDEGQDLVTDNKYLMFDQKQTFYWLAYQVLKSHNKQKRLYWAYDEAQSLTNLTIPQYKSLFGEEFSQALSQAGPTYKGGIYKSEIMPACYRTPGPIITAAHAIGMGLLRSEGLLSVSITTKQAWEQLGYQVQGEFREGHRITLKRPMVNSPNPVPSYSDEYVFQFRTYPSREKEVATLARDIKRNIQDDSLKPREILVVVLGIRYEVGGLTRLIAGQLQQAGLDVFIPSATKLNDLNPKYPNNDPNRFWHDGGVTISDIYRAKGNEADMVYVVAVDNVAKDEANLTLRNQLFVGLTRSKAWVRLSGVGQYPLYDEIKRVVACGDLFEFVFRRNKLLDSCNST